MFVPPLYLGVSNLLRNNTFYILYWGMIKYTDDKIPNQ